MAISRLLIITLMVVTIVSSVPEVVSCNCKFFNFGDSNTDNGGGCAAYGMILKGGCRQSDGQLYIDFLSQNLGMGLLSPYMESVGSNFTSGANFAISQMTASNTTTFHLMMQVKQYARFQYRVRELMAEGKGPMITDHEFRNAIFSLDIGQNDLSYALGLSHKDIITKTIPDALKSIEDAIKFLYDLGARKLIIYNTGPLGCLPNNVQFAKLGAMQLDQIGCVAEYNERAKRFNDGLSFLSTQLRSEMKDAMIVYMDMYSMKYDIIANFSKYGFENPLVACRDISNPTVCVDPSRSVSFDGIHYSHAANNIVASKIESGDYAMPSIKLKDLCALVIKDA